MNLKYILPFIIIILLFSCKSSIQDEVTVYKLPRPPKQNTIIALIVYTTDQNNIPLSLVVKMKGEMGPNIKELKNEFELFCNTLKWNEDGTLNYTKPETWQEKNIEPNNIIERLLSFSASDSNGDVMDVSVFRGTGGTEEENVNRWRNQIGLKHASKQEIINNKEIINLPHLGQGGLFVLR